MLRKYAKIVPFALFAGSAVWSCSPSPDRLQKKAHYFDLKHYMALKTDSLNKSATALMKTVRLNEKTDLHTLRSVNWKKELAFFSQADLNKPSWIGKYRVIDQPRRTDYVSTDQKLNVTRLEIYKSASGSVSGFKAFINIKNYLYTIQEELSFSNTMYTIDRRQKVLFLGDTHYYIQGKMLNK